MMKNQPLFSDEHGGPPFRQDRARPGADTPFATRSAGHGLQPRIGGPAVHFTGVVPPWARTIVKLSQMNDNNA
jgi:hypothetical protein